MSQWELPAVPCFFPSRRGLGEAGEKFLVKRPPWRPGFQRPASLPPSERTTNLQTRLRQLGWSSCISYSTPSLARWRTRTHGEKTHTFQAIFHTLTRSKLGNHVRTIHESCFPIDHMQFTSYKDVSSCILTPQGKSQWFIHFKWKIEGRWEEWLHRRIVLGALVRGSRAHCPKGSVCKSL